MRKPSRFVFALCLWPVLTPMVAVAQDMTPEQAQAYEALFQMTMDGQSRHLVGDLAGAEAAFAAVLALVEAQLPNEPLSRAAALHNLAAVRADLGALQQAEAMAREALTLREIQGAAPRAVASTQWLLSTILTDLDRKPEARDLLQASVISTLNNPEGEKDAIPRDFAALAVLEAGLGNHAVASDLLGQLEPYMAEFPAEDQVKIFSALGRTKSLRGAPLLAEAAYRQALGIADGFPADAGLPPRDRAVLIGNLGTMLVQQSRNAEAAALFRQALDLAPETAVAIRANLLDGLGNALRGDGALQAAFDAQRAALDLRLALLPEGHPQLAASFLATGATLLAAGDAATAREALTMAQAIAAASGDGVRTARAGLALAAADAVLGKASFDRAAMAAADLAALLPAGHPEAARAGFNAAWIGLSESRAADALPLARQALADYAAQARLVGTDATIAAAGAPDMRRQVLSLAHAAWETQAQAGFDDGFAAVQWAFATRAGRAVQRMAARQAASDGALAELIRAKQDLVDQWAALDREYLSALAAGRDAPLREALWQMQGRIAEADAAIAAADPGFAALTQPQILDLAEVRAQLAEDEALLVLSSAADATFVLAVTPQDARWLAVPLTEADLAAQVAALRADLDPNAPTRGAEALDDAPQPARGPRFDRTLAHRMFRDLLNPVAGVLQGKARVLVVADGPLSSLPLSVLVASPPEGDDGDPQALAQTDWLAARHAFVTLPSVAALASLRQRPGVVLDETGQPEPLPAVFAGFGAPDFAGTAPAPEVSLGFAGNRAATDALRALAPLPGTRAELQGLSQQFPESRLALGPEATEAAVKSADLSAATILAFATHGLIAGELRGLAEPALAFTPPALPDETDDGLLTASEVALLRLNADWVILSACNTAAADGTPGAEALSGLASAFLYAGARGLLVSHWPVRDDAAKILTLSAVKALQADPQAGQAAALQQAMNDLRKTPGFEHPSAWAPFVVVGAGP